MKNIALLLLINVLFLPFLMAQTDDETEKRSMEREIKTSGEYLYGEAVADTKEEAAKAAKTALISEINQEIVNNRDWQYAKSIQAKDVEYGTDMIDLMRGNKFRVIAYIKKDNLEVVFHEKAPTIELSDKKEEKTSESSKKKKEEAPVAKVEEAPVVTELVTPEAEPAKKEGVPAVAETPAANVEKAETPEVKPEEAKAPEAESATKKEYYYKNDDLLGKIVKSSSAQEVNKILADNKKNGKAMYGKIETLDNPENAYLIVYKKNGEIIAVLDKGADSRRDLVSGEIKDKSIYTNNQVIWFQIY